MPCSAGVGGAPRVRCTADRGDESQSRPGRRVVRAPRAWRLARALGALAGLRVAAPVDILPAPQQGSRGFEGDRNNRVVACLWSAPPRRSSTLPRTVDSVPARAPTRCVVAVVVDVVEDGAVLDAVAVGFVCAMVVVVVFVCAVVVVIVVIVVLVGVRGTLVHHHVGIGIAALLQALVVAAVGNVVPVVHTAAVLGCSCLHRGVSMHQGDGSHVGRHRLSLRWRGRGALHRRGVLVWILRGLRPLALGGSFRRSVAAVDARVDADLAARVVDSLAVCLVVDLAARVVADVDTSVAAGMDYCVFADVAARVAADVAARVVACVAADVDPTVRRLP
mmetsp:Transcript_16832/g.32228  ORF Transcript_16832/g.32228 Transcript_16832/m.32228 type:complete len:334 (-) Transcript_16832:90-1091(-)